MRMRRNCNLQLCLHPSFGYLPSSASENEHHHQRRTSNSTHVMEGESPDHHHQQLMTIFYNGQVCVCDVNHLQARAIMSLASKEEEEKYESPISSPYFLPSPTTPIYSPKEAAVSMKRSLQRFLQKRRNRIQATSPYHHQ